MNRLSHFHQSILLSATGVFLLILVMWFFNRLPISPFDWGLIWNGIRDGKVIYGDGLFNPPWTLIGLLPLGLLPMRAAWGALVMFTLAVLAFSVPARGNGKVDILAALLLVLSFPSIRQMLDGNLEGVMIAGLLLLVWAYRRPSPVWLGLALLLSTTKIQEAWLALAAVLLLCLFAWPVRRWTLAALTAGLPVLLSLLLLGRPWLAEMLAGGSPSSGLSIGMVRGALYDMSLVGVWSRLGFPPWLLVPVWLALLGATLAWFYRQGRLAINRQTIAYLTAASVLLAPYAAPNSYVTILALGVIPLFQRRRLLGGALLLLANVPYIINPIWQANPEMWPIFWCGLLLLTWLLLMAGWDNSSPKIADV